MSQPLKLILTTTLVLVAAAVGSLLVERRTGVVDEPGYAATPDSLAALSRELGLAGALDSLEAIVAGDSSLLEQAHHWTHELARGAMQASGYDIGLVRECRPVFHSGCYHGALEEYLGHGPPVEAGQVGGLCGAIEETDMPGRLECAHGVGHGLIAGLDHDLSAALGHCGEFSGEDAQWCYSGAFMENVVAGVRESESGPSGHEHGVAGHDGSAHDHLRAEDVHYPCSAVGADLYATCYMYQSFVLLRAHLFDVEAALAACHASPAGALASCYHGMGTQLAGLHPQRPARVHRLCALGDAGLAERCVAGAAEYFVDLDWSAGPGLAFCGDARRGTLEACYRRVGQRLGMIHPDTAAAVCRAIPGTGSRACLAGANAGARH